MCKKILSILNIFLTLQTILVYFFTYNVTIIGLFWLFFQYVNTNQKTLFALTLFKMRVYFIFYITIILFSLAGVPPFLGFFTKLFILTFLFQSSFFSLFITFNILLLLSMYFYLQNLKFLYTYATNITLNYYHNFNLRASLTFFYFSFFLLFFLIFGFIFIDDLFLFFAWLLY